MRTFDECWIDLAMVSARPVIQLRISGRVSALLHGAQNCSFGGFVQLIHTMPPAVMHRMYRRRRLRTLAGLRMLRGMLDLLEFLKSWVARAVIHNYTEVYCTVNRFFLPMISSAYKSIKWNRVQLEDSFRTVKSVRVVVAFNDCNTNSELAG